MTEHTRLQLETDAWFSASSNICSLFLKSKKDGNVEETVLIFFMFKPILKIYVVFIANFRVWNTNYILNFKKCHFFFLVRTYVDLKERQKEEN